MLTDGRTDAQTHGRTDGRKVITIAHPEQSSGELINIAILMVAIVSLAKVFQDY